MSHLLDGRNNNIIQQFQDYDLQFKNMFNKSEFQNTQVNSLICKINDLNEENYDIILEEICPELFTLSQTNLKALSYIYYCIISRKNPFYLKILISNLEKRRKEINRNQLIENIFDKDHHELNIVELFHRCISNKKTWIEELIEACSYCLIESQNLEIIPDILNKNNLNFLWPLILFYTWKEYPEKPEIFIILNQILDYCKNEELEVLRKSLSILQSCQKGPLNNQQCLGLLQEHSILRVLRQASAFDYLHQDDIINLLSQNNSFTNGNSNTAKWDHIVFTGYQLIYTVLNLILDSLEMEKLRRKMYRFSQKATTPQDLIQMLEPLTPGEFSITETNLSKNNANPLDIENLYEEKITKRLNEIKQTISKLYPLNFRLEILEAIFSILFIRTEDLNNESQSSDSGAEGEETDVQKSQNYRAGSAERSENQLSSGSFYKQMSHASGDSSAPSLSQIIVSFSRNQGFLCNEFFIRDLLSFLKDCLVDTSAAYYRSLSENNSDFSNVNISKIPMDQLQTRLQRLSQCVMQASWRFSICSTTKISRPWFFYMDNDDKSDSDDEDTNQIVGKNSRSSSKCRGSSLPTPPSTLVNLMLSSHSSLAVRCLSAGDFIGAEEAVQLCQPPEPHLAAQVNFAVAHSQLISDLESSIENYNFQKYPSSTFLHKTPSIVTLASIKQVTSASLNSTSITSQVETFINRTPLPCYTQKEPSLNSQNHLAALIASDLALTLGNRPEHSSALLAIASSHSNLDQQTTPCSYMNICQQLSKATQVLQDEEVSKLFTKLEFSCEATLPHLLRESRLPIEEKALAQWISKWKDIDEHLENTMSALSNFTGNSLPHNDYRKLIHALKIGSRESTHSILYLQRVYCYLKILSTAYRKHSNKDINCYLSTLQREPDFLLSELVFNHGVPPGKLEPLAKKLRLNLVYAVIRGCCSIIPVVVPSLTLPKTKQLKLPIFSWGSVILNSAEWTMEKIRHPDLAVRCLLEDLYSALSQISISTLILNSKMADFPEIASILNDTAELAHIDITLLTPGEQTTSFCINLYNLIMLHGLLVLGSPSGLFSNEPLLRISSLGCCSYTIGGLGRVNLLDLQRKLLGATLSVAEDIFPEALWPAASPTSDPRHIFSLITGRSDSPALRIIYSESAIENQIQENYQLYILSSIRFQENAGEIYVPTLILDFLEASNLEHEYLQVSAFIEKFIPFQVESRKVIITVDESSECHCVISYSSDNHPSHYKPQASRLPSPRVSLPEHIFHFLERHCWLLGVLVRRIHQNENALEADAPPPADYRLRCLEQAARSEGASALSPLHKNSPILAALHHPPASASGLWARLNSLIKERAWPRCVEMLCALSEIGQPLGPQLEFVYDVIFAKLASQPGSPWLYIEYIGCPIARTRAVIEHITTWPAHAARPALSTLVHAKDSLLASEARDWLARVIIHEQLMIKCPSLNLSSWYQAFDLSQKDPRFVLDHLIDSGEIDLCIEWAELHQVSTQLQWLVDHRFILLLFEHRPPKHADARKILDSLPRIKADALCEVLLEYSSDTASLECLRFVAQFLLDSPNPEMFIRGDSERLWHILAGVSILEELPENGPDKRDSVRNLVTKPWLIMEQLLMHTRLETLEKVVKNWHRYQATHQPRLAINSPLSQASIDGLLRRYAAKALDLRVADACLHNPEPLHQTNSINSESLASQESSKSSAGSPVPSRAPPRSEWVPNEAKAECQCCSLVVFSMFNRRHHCRRCGRVVCHGCSTKTLQVEGYGSVPVRVCENCYAYEMEAQNLNSSETLIKSDDIFVDPNPLSTRWRLSCEEAHNATVREEFAFEHAPSVSLCLAIMKPHSELAAEPRFMIEHAATMLHLLRPNPEIDHALVIKMARSLLVAAKVRYARAGLPMGVSHCDQLLSHAELAGALLRGGGGGWYALEPLDAPHALRRLRDRLVEMELWPQALEVSTKGGLDHSGIWAAWGKACLRAGCWIQARLKFAYCIDQSESSAGRSPPLLSEIIDILEQNASARDQPDQLITPSPINQSPLHGATLRMDPLLRIKSSSVNSGPGCTSASSTALAVLHTLASLPRVAQGQYTQVTPPVNMVVIGPRVDPATYSECRWYLSTYGTPGAHLDFLLRHDDLTSAVRFCKQNNIDPDTFLRHVYLPCLRTGSGTSLHELLLEQGGLENWKDCLRHACAHLERMGAWHILLDLQKLTGDLIRAAMTCTRLYYSGANTYTHLASSVGHLRMARSLLQKALNSDVQGKGSLSMNLGPEELERHLSTVERQIEVTDLVSSAEEAGRAPLVDLANALPSGISEISTSSSPPTLFGSSQERLKVAILCLLSADPPNDLGYSVCLRLISSYELRAPQVFSIVLRQLSLSGRLQNIDILINRIKADFTPNIDWLENTLITCIKILANRIAEGNSSSPKNIEFLIRLLSDPIQKISAYIESRQLKSAYLLAVQHNRLEDVRRIGREAERLGQTVIQNICQKRLQQAKLS